MPRRKRAGRRGLYNKRLTPDEQVVRREDAFAAIRRLYAQVLPLWQSCRRGVCRRHRRCHASDNPDFPDDAMRGCIRRGWPALPPALQEAAWREVIAGGPHRLPPATQTERQLRAFPPSNFVP